MIYNLAEEILGNWKQILLIIGCLICFNSCENRIYLIKNSAVVKNEKIKNMEQEKETNPKDVILSCQAETSDEKIILKYSVENRSNYDIYLLDAYPRYDEKAKTRVADYNSFYLSSHGTDGFFLKGVPPLPQDRMVAMRIMPLGTKIASKEKVERTIELTLPLKEQNNWYYAPLDEEKDYEKTTIDHLIVEVQFMRSTVEEFKAENTSFAPELFNVKSKFTLGSYEKLRSTVNLKETVLLKRTDSFTRL